VTSAKTGRLAGAAIVLASVFLALAAFEYFLAWENSPEPYPPSRVTIQGKEYPFLYPVRDLFSEGHSVNEKRKLFLLGDSFVAGWACAKKQQNLSGHLQRLMGAGVEVVNLGVGGKDPSNYVDLLNHFPIREGDKVVVVLYDNDIHISRETCELSVRQQRNWPLHVPEFCAALIANQSVAKDEEGFLRHGNQILKQFKTFELIKESAYNLPYLSSLFYRSEYTNRWNDFDSEENRWIVSSLPVMRNVAERKGAQFFLAYYPNTNAISADDWRHRVWLKFIEHASRKTQILIGDPYPFFVQNAPRKAMVWSFTDKHPSCDAHLIMARYLHQFVSDSRNARARSH